MNRWFDKTPILSKYVPGKVILSFLMYLLSLSLFWITMVRDRMFCTYAMAFSFLGDFALNHYPVSYENRKASFIIGGLMFIVGHMFYLFAYNTKITIHGFILLNPGAVFAIVILLATTIVFLVKTKGQKRPILFWLCMAYLWLTGINYFTVFSYAYSIKSIESLAMIGGLSFLTSDVIIGAEKLLGLKSKTARELVWWLYPIGQILLIIMA